MIKNLAAPLAGGLVCLLALCVEASPAAAQTATALEEQSCVISFEMGASQDVGNIDFEVDYSAADGEIEGEAANAECARAIAGALTAFNNKPLERWMRAAVIRIAPFRGPITLAACRFRYEQAPPTPGDFDVTVSNAALAGSDVQVNPRPTVVVGAIDCPGELPSGLTTTTTTVSSTSTTLIMGSDRCGFPVTDGIKPAASDALFTLKAAVDERFCDECVCDTDGSGSVSATDALVLLKIAVGGGGLSLDCPPCL